MTPKSINSRYGAIAASLFASIVIVGCSSNSDPQTSVTKAKQYLEQKNPASAVIELKNALQSNPDLGEARFLLGKTYLEEGEFNASEIELRKALALQFDSDQAVPLIASSMLLQGKPEKLIAEFEKQKLQSADAQAELLSVVGMAYLSQRKFDQALSNFSEAQKINPGHVSAVLGEARVNAAKGAFGPAESLANSVLEKNPKYLAALMFKGDLHRAQNQFDKAISAYEQVVVDQPRNINARLNLSNTYLAAGKIEEGRTQIGELKKLAPKHPGVTYFEALLAFNEKQYDKADEAIQRTLVVAPENSQVLLLAGTLEFMLNRPAQSEQHLRKALQIMPDNLFALKSLIRLYLQQKEVPKAEQTLQTAIRISPTDPELLSLAGETAMAKGQFSEASKFFNQSTQLSPSNSRTLTQSAIAQFAQGNNEYAIAQLESASKLDAQTIRPDLLLVLAHMQKKEFDKALQSMESIEKRQPKNALIFNLKAAILLAKDDTAGARKALEYSLTLEPTNFAAATSLAKLDIKEKKFDAAKQRFDSILKKDDKNLPALLALAELEQITGGTKQNVMGFFERAIKSNPDSIQASLAAANYLVSVNDIQPALLKINEALAAKPKNQQLLDAAGMIQLGAGLNTEAVTTYLQLVADNPDQAIFLVRLGEAQVLAGKIEAAKVSMSKALQLKPDSSEVQIRAVGAFVAAGKGADAQRILEKIQKQSPKSVNLPHLEGDVWMAKRDFVNASTAYMKGLGIAPTNGLLIKTHDALFRAGKKSEAESLVSAWLKSHPDDMVVSIYAAGNALRSGDYNKARLIYGEILNRQPDNIVALNNMAWASFQLKDPKALGFAEKAYSLAPSNPIVLDSLGWILVQQQQVKRGIDLLQQASNEAPKRLDIKLHLAKALIKDGRKEDARGHLQAIVKAEGSSELGKESSELLKTL